jgi:peptidylprolyl isomerase
MVLKQGDFILITYVGTIKETGKVFDTNIEETAKNENLYKESEIYEAQLVVIGEGWVLKALEESLLTMKVRRKKSIEIPPEKAFGLRDPSKVKRVSLRQLTARGITPNIGKRIEYNGKMATIRTLGAGRVLLDFNQTLAGKTLIYEVTIQKKLTLKSDKIRALIHRRIPAIEDNKFNFTLQKNKIEIVIPQEAFYLEGIQVAKRGIALDLKKFIRKIEIVKFIEIFEDESKT